MAPDYGSDTSNSQPFSHEISVTIPFPKETWVDIAKQVLSVDIGPKAHLFHRTLHQVGSSLVLTMASSDLKFLRTTMNGFMEDVKLVIRTLESFGESTLVPVTMDCNDNDITNGDADDVKKRKLV